MLTRGKFRSSPLERATASEKGEIEGDRKDWMIPLRLPLPAFGGKRERSLDPAESRRRREGQ